MNKFIPLSFTALLVFGCGGDSSSSDVNNSKEKLKDTNIISSHILKTGQSRSYTNFDDGYYKKGLARNYTRDDTKDIVIDHTLGLEWQDDGRSLKCETLDLNGTGWRLPTITELGNLINYAEDDLIQKEFKHIGHTYQSSTGYLKHRNFGEESNTTWSISFGSNGIYFSGDDEDNNQNICVRSRGKETEDKDSYRKNGNTVTDLKRGLVWQNNVDSERRDWSNAIEYCHNLTLSGFTDWRLPNINELATLIDHNNSKSSGLLFMINPIFNNIHPEYQAYWSSTNEGYILGMSGAGTYSFSHQNKAKYLLHTRCIRDDAPMKFISCTNPRPEVCTADYTPVCAKVVNGSTISYDTKSNSCSACLDHKVLGYSKGECQ